MGGTGYAQDVSTPRSSTNTTLIFGVIVLCGVAMVIAVLVDAPASVWILAAIALVGSLISLAFGLHADRA